MIQSGVIRFTHGVQIREWCLFSTCVPLRCIFDNESFLHYVLSILTSSIIRVHLVFNMTHFHSSKTCKPCLPNNAPKAKPTLPFVVVPTAVIALKMSGDPLPKARIVTPCENEEKKLMINRRVKYWNVAKFWSENFYLMFTNVSIDFRNKKLNNFEYSIQKWHIISVSVEREIGVVLKTTNQMTYIELNKGVCMK